MACNKGYGVSIYWLGKTEYVKGNFGRLYSKHFSFDE